MNRHQARNDRMAAFVHGDLDRHQMTGPSSCRAWTFQRVTKDKGRQWCPYGFKLVWTPGMFQLFGDIDELTLTHYDAIGRDLRSSLEWLYSSNFSYLAGKSNAKKEYDQEATVERVWERLFEEATYFLQVYRHELAEWRDKCAEIRAANEILLDDGEEIPERPLRPSNDEIDEPFRRLADVIGAAADNVQCRSAWRKGLRRLLMARPLTENEAAEFSYELFDDFEMVKYEWPRNLEMQIAAMQFAANQILIVEFETSLVDRLVDWLIKIFPRWGLPA